MAVLLAALAGVCAAVAIVDLAAEWPRRPRRRGGLALVLRAVGRRLGAPAPPADLDARLDAAGRPLDLTAADLMALKCGAAVAGALLGLSASSLAPGRLGVLVVVVAPLGGFLAPDLALKRRQRRRREAIELELPDVCELLRVAVEAGLATNRAIEEVGRRHPGLLAQELRGVAARQRLGEPRTQALDALTRRAPAPGVATLAAAIRRADRHGAPLAPALDALAREARAERARAIRDRAARAAPQIQLVVALLLVPAVLLLVAAALVAGLV